MTIDLEHDNNGYTCAFILWREFKLSIAELSFLFAQWTVPYCSHEVIIVGCPNKKAVLNIAKKLGWTKKIIEITKVGEQFDPSIFFEWIICEKKYRYGMNIFWKQWLRKILHDSKVFLKKHNISSRYINKDYTNLSTAQILWEDLLYSESDFNIIATDNWYYFGHTIWIQDIEGYTKRDISKHRNMKVWMLPPKLAQMMINISEGNTIYDPFVGLWTVLIESINMGNTKVFWSDISSEILRKAQMNVEDFSVWKDVKFKFDHIDAKKIEESDIFNVAKIDAIVTEWFLWKVVNQKNASIETIDEIREEIFILYSQFFKSLAKSGFKWKTVIALPFWEIHWKYYYFDEIYEVIQKHFTILPLITIGELYRKLYWFPELPCRTTKIWSLLYKRDNQYVWREIFKLEVK